jgi:hypothetical protein
MGASSTVSLAEGTYPEIGRINPSMGMDSVEFFTQYLVFIKQAHTICRHDPGYFPYQMEIRR